MHVFSTGRPPLSFEGSEEGALSGRTSPPPPCTLPESTLAVCLYTLWYSVEICTHLCRRQKHSQQCSKDQKLYMMAFWLIFGVKSFLNFKYLLSFSLSLSLPFYPFPCVSSAVKDVGNSHTWPGGEVIIILYPCHPATSTAAFNHKWRYMSMWLSWHRSEQSLMNDFDV